MFYNFLSNIFKKIEPLRKNVELLNFDKNAKTVKGQKRGVMTGVLYLAPFKLSGVNVCPHASAGCAAACLNTAGRGVFNFVKKARLTKTKSLFNNREEFIALLKREINNAIVRANKVGAELAIRLNGTSDLPWENMFPMEEFPMVQFYDYTKNPLRMNKFLDGGMPSNYDLTFSLSETNKPIAVQILKRGGNVAMVFDTKDEKEFPKEYMGYKVVNGDKDDLRFKDKENVIVALKMKGRAIYDTTGFVQPCA